MSITDLDKTCKNISQPTTMTTSCVTMATQGDAPRGDPIGTLCCQGLWMEIRHALRADADSIDGTKRGRASQEDVRMESLTTSSSICCVLLVYSQPIREFFCESWQECGLRLVQALPMCCQQPQRTQPMRHHHQTSKEEEEEGPLTQCQPLRETDSVQ